MNNILKIVGAVVVVTAVFAFGYWQGRSHPKADHESGDHAAAPGGGSEHSASVHDTNAAATAGSATASNDYALRRAMARPRRSSRRHPVPAPSSLR